MEVSEVRLSPEEWLDSQKFPACGKCDIAIERKFRSYVKPRGALNSFIVLVGEAPGAKEEDENEAFIGPAGQLLDEIFQEAGVNTRELMYITNTVKCRPLQNRTPVSAECRTCRELFLKQEVLAYPRKLIIALGNIGYYGVVPKGSPSGIMRRSGIFEENEEFGCLVLPCIHAAAVLRNPSNEVLLKDVAAKVRKFIDDGYQLPDQHSTIYKEARDLESFDQLLQELRSHKQFVVDLETTGFNFWGDRILCMTFSTSSYTAWYLPLEENAKWLWSKDDWTLIQEGLRAVFEDPTIGKIGHNLKFDLKFLIHHFGWDVQGKLDDPMLMHHLLDENTAHGLKPLAARFTDLGDYSKKLEDAFKEIKRSKIPIEDKHYGKIPVDILKYYASIDADATYRLYEIFKGQLKLVGEHQKLYKFYSKIITWVMSTLMRMELTGVRVDTKQMTQLQKEFSARLEELQSQINTYAEGDINIRSTKQLRELLYVQLGLEVINDPHLRTPKGGASTDEATLKALKARDGHPILDLLLEYRRTSKLNSTYIVGLLRELAPDNRLHTSYMQHGTATGRLSSSRPNLQNIPRESIIKSLFVPTEGWYFVRGDYSQHELRMWANYSQDPKFIKALASQDVHSYIGSILLNKDPVTISKDERTKVKGVVFGLIYGRGTRSLAAEFNMTTEEAQQFTDAFFKMFPESSAWLNRQEEVVKKAGQVVNQFGRVRRLPEVHSTDAAVAAMATRQARNCIKMGTLISTSKGLVPIETLCNASELSLTAPGMFESVTIMRGSYSGRKSCVRVELEDGRIIELTRDHIVYHLNEAGGISSKPIADVSPGDFLITPLGGYDAPDIALDWKFIQPHPPYGWTKEVTVPHKMSPKLAELLGILVGDGCMNFTQNSFSISVGHRDKPYVQHICTIMKELFDIDPAVKLHPYKGHNNFCIEVNSVVVKRFLDHLGLSAKATHKNKVVPWSVLQSSQNCHAAFLKGLFDTDGSISPTSGFCFSCFHEVLGRQVQLMLLGLGIPSKISKEKNSNNWNIYIRTRAGKLLYVSLVSSNHPFKVGKLEEYVIKIARAKTVGYSRSVPSTLLKRVRDLVRSLTIRPVSSYDYGALMGYGVSAARMLKVYIPALQAAGQDVEELKSLLQLQYNEVTSILPIGMHNTFDLCVQEDPPVFLSNGIAVHNSPIQSLASDITNFALARINKTFKQQGLRARLLMQIHDEIVAEAPRDEVLTAYNIMRDQMMKAPLQIEVPLKVDLGIVDRWGGEYIDLAQFE